MKAVMYHYVREFDPNLPHFTFLDLGNFKKQVDYFQREFGFVARDHFLDWVSDPIRVPEPTGVILTFDDGFRDHFSNVLPFLQSRNLWGIFYIPSQIMAKTRALDVHKIHLLLGKLGGKTSLSLLRAISSDANFPYEHLEAFHNSTYTNQNTTSEAAKIFKRMLNYFSGITDQTQLLEKIIVAASLESEWTSLESNQYLTAAMLKTISDSGNVVGSHSVSHRVMSKLSIDQQEQEIALSKETLETITCRTIETFCYPFGGDHSFTSETQRLLQTYGFKYSFNVENRELTTSDIVKQPHRLPRFDCNYFPFGSATTYK